MLVISLAFIFLAGICFAFRFKVILYYKIQVIDQLMPSFTMSTLYEDCAPLQALSANHTLLYRMQGAYCYVD